MKRKIRILLFWMLSQTKWKQWKIILHLNGRKEEFKIDTGAAAVSEQVHQKIEAHKLQLPPKLLNGPTEYPLEVLGEFKRYLKHKHKVLVHQIFVVKGLKTNLLGLSATTSLELLCILNQIENTDWLSKYSQVLNGLGTLEEPYQIRLKPNAQTYAYFFP